MPLIRSAPAVSSGGSGRRPGQRRPVKGPVVVGANDMARTISVQWAPGSWRNCGAEEWLLRGDRVGISRSRTSPRDGLMIGGVAWDALYTGGSDTKNLDPSATWMKVGDGVGFVGTAMAPIDVVDTVSRKAYRRERRRRQA